MSHPTLLLKSHSVSPCDEPGADKKFLGSAFIVQADSMAEVRARMEADVYWSGNVVSLLSSIALGNG